MAVDIARALKDPEYRKTLTAEELKQLPPEELTEEELRGVGGGALNAYQKPIYKVSK